MSRILSAVRDSGGISLMFIIFLMLVVSISAIGFLTYGVKLRAVKKDRITLERLDTVQEALQRYYLSHHDLPAPATTSPSNSIPAAALNLPQEFRFDSAGQFIHYDRSPDTGMVDILGITVHGESVAAVLVAPGPDRQIADSNRESPYADPSDSANDDVVVAVSLNAEAIKIATRAVAVLQGAAKAYDRQFDEYNNDGDYSYPIWYIPENDPVDPADDEYITPQPLQNIDEGNDEIHRYVGYVPAAGGSGSGCVRFGRLDNDPERGTASLDGCTTAARDIAAVYGLSERYITDPWGNPYQWGSVRWVENGGLQEAYGGLEATDIQEEDDVRDRHYWSFFSMGPDKIRDTADDITPTTDRIDGYYSTEP